MTWPVLESLLRLADEGREALQTKSSYGVLTNITHSQMPASYEANSNTCTLNSSLKPATLASYFVHEMVHALNEKGGWASDINSLSQDEYVQEMVMEELVATTRQYQFFVRLDVDGKLPAMSASEKPPRYWEYRSAYDTGVKRGRAVTSDPDRLHLLGIVNANRLLAIFIKEYGLGVGALSYREYYGRQWQKGHP